MHVIRDGVESKGYETNRIFRKNKKEKHLLYRIIIIVEIFVIRGISGDAKGDISS